MFNKKYDLNYIVRDRSHYGEDKEESFELSSSYSFSYYYESRMNHKEMSLINIPGGDILNNCKKHLFTLLNVTNKWPSFEVDKFTTRLDDKNYICFFNDYDPSGKYKYKLNPIANYDIYIGPDRKEIVSECNNFSNKFKEVEFERIFKAFIEFSTVLENLPKNVKTHDNWVDELDKS